MRIWWKAIGSVWKIWITVYRTTVLTETEFQPVNKTAETESTSARVCFFLQIYENGGGRALWYGGLVMRKTSEVR